MSANSPLVCYDYDRDDLAHIFITERWVAGKENKCAKTVAYENATVLIDYNSTGDLLSVDVVLKPETGGPTPTQQIINQQLTTPELSSLLSMVKMAESQYVMMGGNRDYGLEDRLDKLKEKLVSLGAKDPLEKRDAVDK